jgi:hypothetical protein
MSNCKTVCREIEDSGVEQVFSEMTAQHLLSCATCHAFHESRLRLRQLVAGLGMIEAPSDFDFRVRARLASEKGRSQSTFSISRQAFGFPAAALVAIALLIGAGFALRVLLAPTNVTPLAQKESPKANPPVAASEEKASAGNQEVAKATVNSESQTKPLSKPSDVEPRVLGRKDPRGTAAASARNTSVRNNGPVASRDFSSGQARVVKREESVRGNEKAAVFPVEASEPLKVSLDYATGISRTISLPTLSFGSQQLVNTGVSPMVKASVKGVW